MWKVKVRIYGPARNYSRGLKEVEVELEDEIQLRELLRIIDEKWNCNLLEALNNKPEGLTLIVVGGDEVLNLKSKVKPNIKTIHILPPASGG